MRIMMLGTSFFMVGFMLHWLVWRIRVPMHANSSLLGLFSVGLCICFVMLRTLSALRPFYPHDLWEYLHVSLFYVSMTLSYIVAYSALDGDSPSTTMVKFVAISGQNGRGREEFSKIITNDLNIESRLSALVQSGLVVRDHGKIKLTSQGIFWHKLFNLWVRLLCITKGG